jgi:SAM-dependent methyltransferase
MIDRRTGAALPDAGEIESAVPEDWSAVECPVPGNLLLSRLDSSDDEIFYREPRFVEHVDDQAVRLLTRYVSSVAVGPDTRSVLDLCSSWTSHLEVDDGANSKVGRRRVAGLGMNAEELRRNPALTEWTVQDLNNNPTLPYSTDSFDCVLCQLSIDYLTRPLQVCREVARVLVPGGKVHILFSNRLFLSKAVALWTGADDVDRAFTVASYLHFCCQDGRRSDSSNGEAKLLNIRASDLSMRGKDGRIRGDPLYVVTAVKSVAGEGTDGFAGS